MMVAKEKWSNLDCESEPSGYSVVKRLERQGVELGTPVSRSLQYAWQQLEVFKLGENSGN